LVTGASQFWGIPDFFYTKHLRKFVFSFSFVFCGTRTLLQHFKIFGSWGMAPGPLQPWEIPEIVHAKGFRSFVLSLFPVFFWNYRVFKHSILKYLEIYEWQLELLIFKGSRTFPQKFPLELRYFFVLCFLTLVNK
jgi:hypothetical protein